VATREDGRVTIDVLLVPHTGADPDADHTTAIRAVLTERAAAMLRRVEVVHGDGQMITGPTGKVRKFLMRQRQLADAAVR
jgi:hypothetical protein